eukprot:1299295-Pleurochrysis_carterae.AAC.1
MHADRGWAPKSDGPHGQKSHIPTCSADSKEKVPSLRNGQDIDKGMIPPALKATLKFGYKANSNLYRR